MKKNYNQFKEFIKQSKKILILTHKGPDVDAFCSSLLLKQILLELYPKKKVVFRAKQNPSLKLPGMKGIEMVKELKSEGFDLIILTDAGDLSLCIEDTDNVEDSIPQIIIDHHDTFFEKKKNTVLINENMSSATEQVYMLFRILYKNKFKLNEDSSTLVQYGIVADTGRFLYDIMTPNTHRVFADAKSIVDVDLEDFAYRNSKFPREATHAIIKYLESLKIEKDMAYMFVDRKDLEEDLELKQGASEAQAFLRDRYLRFIQGVHWGFIIKPDMNTKDSWFVSFRSTKGYQDVRVIAEELGGGGHTYASGVLIKADSIEALLTKILNIIEKHLKA